MYGLELDHKEGWAPTNWCFPIVVLEKTLESPLNCKIKPVNPKGNQPYLHWKDWCWSWSCKTLATQMLRADSLENTLMLGKIEGGTKRGRQRWLDSITDSVGMNVSKLREIVEDREAWCVAIHWVAKGWTRLSNWTTNLWQRYFKPPSIIWSLFLNDLIVY